MRALVFHGPGEKAWEEVPDPTVRHPADAVVKIDTTTICGSDLHILKGDVPEVADGTVLGHEGVGTVVETGPAVASLKAGDRVLISCITGCGTCSYCLKGNQYAHCQGDGVQAGGWQFGHLIDGTQAEYVRVPYAEVSTYKLPEAVSSEDATMLSDILPTGHEIGVQAGAVSLGDVVAVVGAGPVGLAAIATAGFYGPSRVIAIDLDAHRVEEAKAFGATDGVVASDPDWREQVLALTDGLGVDVSIEAVGIPQTWDMTLSLVRPGGHVANVGVHGKPVSFPLERYWIENITITTGLVNTSSTATLLKLLEQGRLDAARFITHRYRLDDVLEAYDVFSRAAETKALKVVMSA